MASALDDEDLRQRLLAKVVALGVVRGACKAVGVSRTTLARYVKQHPEFRAVLERAKEGAAPHRRVLERARAEFGAAREAGATQAVEAQVLTLPAPSGDRKTCALPDLGFDVDDAYAFRVISAKMLLDRDENPHVRRACHAYLASFHLTSTGPASGEPVYVELPAKDEIA